MATSVREAPRVRSQPPGGVPVVVAERYRLEQELARGGMGVVFRAVDEITGKAVALKRLLTPGSSGLNRLLFEREYQTLATLRHPRIIEVYDYGVDAGRAFYTMELLDGEDMAALAPLPWRKVCGYLRDVAASLVLLHARQLLHRDLSPHNVRITSDGHCKLIDFGALCPFGIAAEIVGTPSFISPELVRGLALDQRADLFSLGALAHFMLTGRRAFRVKGIRQLEEAWAVPVTPPSQARESEDVPSEDPIPTALDELVLGLLSMDPLARPTSAAEVIERLNSIAGLDEDAAALGAEHYLVTEIIGRDAELGRLLRAVDKGTRGRTGGILIEGPSGTGASRLLGHVALHARLSGATVLTVDGSVCQGLYSGVRALIASLFELVPQDAAATLGDDGALLARAFPELSVHASRDGAPAATHANPGTLRASVQSALSEWWLRLAKRRRLVIAVDEVQAVDEASAAVLAGLSVDAPSTDLVVAFALRSTDTAVAPAALAVLQSTAERIVLKNLDAQAMAALVRSMLGDVPHAGRLTEWLQGLTGGNPAEALELVRHLVDTGVIDHRQGVWILPQELSADELPSGAGALQARRLDGLSATARRLVEAMSLHSGPMSLELCASLLSDCPTSQVLAALDQLVRANLLRVSGSTYYFAQELLRTLVSARLPTGAQRLLHRKLAECLLGSGDVDTQRRLDAGWHLVHAGEEVRGADLLRVAALDLVNRYDDMIAATPPLEAALRIYREQKRRPEDLIELLLPLSLAGYFVDWRLAGRYAVDTLEIMEELTGLALARKLRPWLGRHLSTYVGLAFGALRYLLTPRLGGIKGLKAGLAMFSTVVTFLCGKATICLDPAEAEAWAAHLEPLTVLGKRHAASVTYRYAMGMAHLARGHTAHTVREFKEVLEVLKTPERLIDYPMHAHAVLYGGALYALGAMQGFTDRPDALETADELEGLGLKLYSLAADQIRVNYYACQGDLENAARHRRSLDTHALRNGSAWQAEVWAPASQMLADTATNDVISAKRTWGELQRLSEEMPSLGRYEIGAHTLYLLQTGRAEDARRRVEDMFAGSPPNGFIGWTTSRGSLAAAHIALGQHEEARRVCEETLALLEPDDLDYVALNLRVELQLAYAEAGLGEVDRAVSRLQALLAKHGPNEGPVTLGQIHFALATIALEQRDAAGFEEHRAAVDRWYQPTGNPALVAQAQRLVTRAHAAKLDASGRDTVPGPEVAPARYRHWAIRFEQCRGASQRAETALAVLVECSGARSGVLFAPRASRMEVLASLGGAEPAPEVVE
ncbi:MAG TPA: AAA family ATPase, partial [Polyangiaceae bacterium]